MFIVIFFNEKFFKELNLFCLLFFFLGNYVKFLAVFFDNGLRSIEMISLFSELVNQNIHIFIAFFGTFFNFGINFTTATIVWYKTSRVATGLKSLWIRFRIWIFKIPESFHLLSKRSILLL